MDESHPDDKASPQESPTVAPPPFDGLDADVVLRSSDNVDFHVFKLILSLVSPLFSTMFTLPPPAETSVEAIDISEDSNILAILLGYCYPLDLPGPSTIDEALRTWELCKKYEMTGIETHIRKSLAQQLSEQEPICAFVLAMCHGLTDEARVAARRSLAISPLERPYVPELEGITAGQYHRLLQYYHACTKKALAVTKEPYMWITSDSFIWLTNHQNGSDYCNKDPVELGIRLRYGGSRVSSRWWINYMQSCGRSLVENPAENTISMASRETGLALEEAYRCPQCRKNVHRDMVEFVKLFSAEVDRAVSEVKLDLTL